MKVPVPEAFPSGSTIGRRRFLSLAAGGALLGAFGTRTASGASAPQIPSSLIPTGATSGDWPLFGHNLLGTRFNPEETRIGPDTVDRLQVKWVFEDAGGPSQSTPIVVGDSLYFSAHDGHIYSLDARSGRLKWKFDAWEGMQPDPVPMKQTRYRGNVFRTMRASAGYAGGRIYIGDGNSHFRCLDAETGREIWKTVLDPEAGANQSHISSSPMIYQDKVFVGLSTTAGRSYAACLDANTGALRWRFNVVPDPDTAGGGAIWTAPALDVEAGIVYNVTGNPHGHPPGVLLFSESIIANDMESGELLWYDQLRSNDAFDLDFSCHPILFEARHPQRPEPLRRCVGAGSKTGFHTYDRYTGERLWSTGVTNGGPTLNSTAFAYDMVYMVSNSIAEHRPQLSATVALHAWTGDILWWKPNQSSIQGAVAVANQVFYQGLRDGSLQGLHVETGEPLWRYELPGVQRGGITVAGGTLYANCGGGTTAPHGLYAFTLDGR